MTSRALFLDRDGVINVDHGYVYRPEQFDLQPGILELMRAAMARGFLLIVVTNQSGLARGLFSQDEYDAFESYMRDILEANGISLAGLYHCPHHPQGTVSEFSIVCDCRKPLPGMILKAAADHNIDLAHSVMIGDKDSDVQAAAAAGIGTSYKLCSDTVRADLERIASEIAVAPHPF